MEEANMTRDDATEEMTAKRDLADKNDEKAEEDTEQEVKQTMATVTTPRVFEQGEDLTDQPANDWPNNVVEVLNTLLQELRQCTEPDSAFQRNRSGIARKDLLHHYFGKYSNFEKCPLFTDSMKEEFQTLVVKLVRWHQEHLQGNMWKDSGVGDRRRGKPQGRTHVASIDPRVLKKRKGWFGEEEESGAGS